MTPEKASQRLFEAAETNNVSSTRAAIDANLRDKDKWQRTPLHLAAGNSNIANEQPGHAGCIVKRRCNDEPQVGG